MTDYRILSAGTYRASTFGAGRGFACLRLQVGKRPKLEVLRLSDAEALEIAAQLVASVQQRITP